MAHLDLDAKRAARSEAEQTPHEVVLGGETFELAPMIPLEALDLMADAAFREAFALLLGPEDATRFFRHKPDQSDLEQILSLYGEPGESLASAASSPSIGKRSRPTSKRTTTSTSRPAATATASAAPGSSSSD
jgi:hypothetical protein